MFFHLLPGFVPAFTWVGLGADANWTTAGNWSTGAIPGAANTAIFDFNCTVNCNPTINASISVGGFNIKSTYAGTITQGAGNTITIGTAGWTQQAGTFTGAGANVTMNGFFSLSGGTYTATSGTWTQSSDFTITGGTFNHNSGSWATNSIIVISANGATFNNVSFDSNGYDQNLNSSTMIVVGTLTFASTSNGGNVNSGTIEARGDILTTGVSGKSGSALVRINGTGAQTLTATAGWIPSVEINKASGTLSLVGIVKTTGSWTWLSGTISPGTSTLYLDRSTSITPGPTIYNNVTFDSNGETHNLNATTMFVGGTLTLNSTSNGGSISNGAIEARGDISTIGNGKAGTATIKINGTGAQTLTGTSGWIPSIEINKASGTLSLAGTVITKGSWTWLLGTISAGVSTLVFDGSASITPGPVIYNNVTFDSNGETHNLNSGTISISGTAIFTSTPNSGNLNNGSINASGNVNFQNTGKSGTAILNFTGASNTTLTIGALAGTLSTTHNVAKTGSAKVSLVATTAYATAGRNFSITSGVLDMNGFNFSVNSTLTIGASGTLLCNGGTATAGTWSISGQISCGAGQGISWNGLAGDNLWSTAGNWTNNNIPSATDAVIFNANCAGANCNAQIDSNVSVRGLNLTSSYIGTLTQNATRTLTVGTGNYVQAGGTFAGGNAAVNMNGTFLLTGGTYTATSATWNQAGSMTISGSPTFNHNSGTWLTNDSITINPSTVNFFNVTFGGGNQYQNLNNGTMNVIGTLNLSDTNASGGGLTSGTINARGNIIFSNFGKAGTAVIRAAGSSNQSVTGISSALVPAFEIASTGGTVTFFGTISYRRNFTYTSGAVDTTTNTSTFSFTGTTGSYTIIPGNINYHNVTFAGDGVTHTLSSGTMNVLGTLTLADSNGTVGSLNSGTIEARGNIVLSSQGKYGSALIKASGSGNQTITGTSTSWIPTFEIASTGGTVTFSGSILYRGNFTYTSGLVDATTNSTTMLFTGNTGGVTHQINGITGLNFHHVSFGGNAVSYNLNSTTMTVLGNLSLSDINGTYGSLNSGTINVSGNINLTGQGKGGTAIIRVAGSSSQTITGITTANCPPLEIASTGGTVSFSGTIVLRSTFTYTSGTIDATGSTVRFEGPSVGSIVHTVTGVNFNNVILQGNFNTQSLNSGTLVVLGTLTLTDTHPNTAGFVNSGTIEARGHVVITGAGKSGNANLILNGTSTTDLTWTAGTFLTSTVSIAKTGGASVRLMTNATFTTAGRDLTITSGTLDLFGYDLTVNDVLTVGVGATLKCNGGEIGTPLPASVVNSGTINCPGYATYDFNWTGAGGNTNWTTAGNWQGGVAPAASDIVVFENTYCGAACSATVNTSSSIKGARLRSPYTGTITQGSGNTLTIGTRGWTQAAGTFTGGDSNITNAGNFTLSGGTFTSTSATYTLQGLNWNSSAGTFAHNNGTVISDSNPVQQNTTFTTGTNEFNNLNLIGWAGSYSISGTTIVNGHLQFGSASGSASGFYSGTILAKSHVTMLNNGTANSSATTIIEIAGTGAQTITGSNGSWPGLRFNKPSGTVTLSGSLIVTGILTYTAGTVDAGTSTVNLLTNSVAITHNPNGMSLNNVIFSHEGSGSLSLNSQTLNILGTTTFTSSFGGGQVINSGTINMSGNLVQSGTVVSSGSAQLNLIGTIDTTITPIGSLSFPGSTVNINKTSGAKVTLLGNTRFNNAGQNLTITAGTLDMAGFNLTVGNNISNSGTLKRGNNPGCGTISQGGSYSGTAAICP